MQVGVYDLNRPKKRLKVTKKGKGKVWVLKKKEQMKKEINVPPDIDDYDDYCCPAMLIATLLKHKFMLVIYFLLLYLN